MAALGASCSSRVASRKMVKASSVRSIGEAAMHIPTLKTLTRFALVTLAALGLVIPTAAQPCCGCCEVKAQPANQTGICCSKRQACCEAPTQNRLARCCHGTNTCGGPECTCNVLPAHAIPLASQQGLEKPNAKGSLAIASIALPPLAGTLLADQSWLDGVATPHFIGAIRLHSRLCVWLN